MDRLRTERMSLDDLMADARQKGIHRFDEIELAVLETNGRVSFNRVPVHRVENGDARSRRRP